MPMNVSKAVEKVNGYLSEISSLLEKSYKEGKDEKEGLYIRLEHFVSYAFPDGKERLVNFRMSFPIQVALSGQEETEGEKQEDYIRDLKIMQNNLVAYEEELQLEMSSDKKPDDLGKIKIENLNEKDTAERLFDSLITHPKIKQASQNHFKNEEYRLAVLDALISLEVMIKEKAKFPADNKGKELSGVSLMHKVFDSDNPILSWCKGKRQIDRDELEGYKHIFAGAMQGIRDPKAHAIFQISPMRALKLLTLATLLAELVDASKYVEQDQRNDATKLKEAKKHNKGTSELWKPLPKIDFTVTQRLLRKLQFPQVGWEAYNDSPYQLKVRIEVHPILGGRDLHPLPDNDINGNKVYPVEPQRALFGNGCFTLPEVCATSKDELILEIQATIEDINDPKKGEYKIVPQRWKYVRENDIWSYYPQRPMAE